MINSIIEQLFQTALTQLGYPNEAINFEPPNHSIFGDLSTSIAMRLASKTKQAPLVFAQTLINAIPAHEAIEKIEMVKPGFINVTIKNQSLLQGLQEAKQKQDFITSESPLKDKKIIVEYTDPNPFKEFHIGHVYTNTVGESIARLLEAVKANVRRANYQGDVGLHVAKSIWGMQKALRVSNRTIEDIASLPLLDRINWLGKSYAHGSALYESHEIAKKEIQTLNFLVYVAAQKTMEKQGWKPQIDYKKYITIDQIALTEVQDLYSKGRTWSLEYFETIYARLGTKFDLYYFESTIGEYGVQIVHEYVKKGVFIESKGAIVFPGEKYGLHTRVFLNSMGLPTYEAKELGLAPQKFKDFAYDFSLIITGNEISEYFKVLLCALNQIRPDLAKKTTHIGHGMVTLTTGKMSSRTGQVITGNAFISATCDAVKAIIKKSGKIKTSDIDSVSETVAIAAIKYAFLKSSIGKNIVYNEKESLNFEGDTGPYLQYTYARCFSVLRKVQSPKKVIVSSTITKEENEVLHTASQFGMILLKAAETHQPHLLCSYLYRMASAFNAFYQQCPITTAEKEYQSFRIFLTQISAEILKIGLHVLGIHVLESM